MKLDNKNYKYKLKENTNEMEVDEQEYSVKLYAYPPSAHSGYSPIKDGKILGRFKFYDVAQSFGCMVMTYGDAVKRGYKY